MKNNTFFVQGLQEGQDDMRRARQGKNERDKGGMKVKYIGRVRVIGVVQSIGE